MDEMDQILNEAIDDYLEDIDAEAYYAGYNMNADIENGVITFTGRQNPELMPTITAVRSDEDGYLFFHPTMKFPELSYIDMDYNDSFEYYVGRWAESAALCTYLEKNPLDLAGALDRAGYEYQE